MTQLNTQEQLVELSDVLLEAISGGLDTDRQYAKDPWNDPRSIECWDGVE